MRDVGQEAKREAVSERYGVMWRLLERYEVDEVCTRDRENWREGRDGIWLDKVGVLGYTTLSYHALTT